VYIYIRNIEGCIRLKEGFLHFKVLDGEGKDERVRLKEVFDLKKFDCTADNSDFEKVLILFD